MCTSTPTTSLQPAAQASDSRRTCVAHAGSSTSTTQHPLVEAQRPHVRRDVGTDDVVPAAEHAADGAARRPAPTAQRAHDPVHHVADRTWLVVVSHRRRARLGVDPTRCRTSTRSRRPRSDDGAGLDADDPIGVGGVGDRPGGGDHDLARREATAAARRRDGRRARTARRRARAPASTRCARPPGGVRPGAGPAPACAARPGRRGCAPAWCRCAARARRGAVPTVDTPRRTSSPRAAASADGQAVAPPRRVVAERRPPMSAPARSA